MSKRGGEGNVTGFCLVSPQTDLKKSTLKTNHTHTHMYIYIQMRSPPPAPPPGRSTFSAPSALIETICGYKPIACHNVPCSICKPNKSALSVLCRICKPDIDASCLSNKTQLPILIYMRIMWKEIQIQIRFANGNSD